MSVGEGLTQNIGEGEEDVPPQLHFRIINYAPLQISSQEPDTRTLKMFPGNGEYNEDKENGGYRYKHIKGAKAE